MENQIEEIIRWGEDLRALLHEQSELEDAPLLEAHGVQWRIKSYEGNYAWLGKMPLADGELSFFQDDHEDIRPNPLAHDRFNVGLFVPSVDGGQQEPLLRSLLPDNTPVYGRYVEKLTWEQAMELAAKLKAQLEANE